MTDNLRIKIFCRSFDLKLYRLSRGLYESWGWPCVRLTDQTADGYFRTILADQDCDIAVNVDEDCFMIDKDTLLQLIDYVVEHELVNAGCPDGGGWGPRGGNPIVTNPFFNVLNLRLIRLKYGKTTVKAFDYSPHREAMEKSFPKEMLYENRPYDFACVDKEPYYPFFLWLASIGQTLYLHSRRHADNITTILYGHTGKVICMHTWFARFYTVPAWIAKHWQKNISAQQARIDNIIREAYSMQNMPMPRFGMKDRLSFIGNKIVRWLIKVPQRILNWPNKLRKKLSKN